MVGPGREGFEDEWSDSDNEPLCLLGKPRQIPPPQIHEDTEIVEVAPTDQTTQNRTVTPTTPPRQVQVDEEGQGQISENPRELGEVSPRAIAQGGTRETIDGCDENVDSVEGEGQGINESQPYPYSLRPLLGRHNYGSGMTTNK